MPPRIRIVLALVVASLLAVSPAHARKAKKSLLESAVAGFIEEHDSTTIPAQGTVEIAFSPNGGCTAATVRFVNEARHSIRLAAYGLTSNPIGKALVEAKKRGVDVQAVVDREHNGKRDTPNSVVAFLAANDIPVRVDRAVKIQHNKFIVVDGEAVQNGSFNFTSAAQTSNAENIAIHRGTPEMAKLYEKRWDRLWAESDEYRGTY